MNHRDRVTTAEINVTSDRELTGHRCSTSWSDEQHVYFMMQFSKPFKKSGIYKGGILSDKRKHGKGILLRSYVTFDTQEGEAVYVKVGISAVSIEGARKNLEADQAGWDFDKVAFDAKQQWNKELSKIEIESKDSAMMRTFYTAMYHAMTAPYLYQDADGKYRGMDRQIHETKNFEYYTVFSIWDTYRALHPLLALIDRKRTSDFVNTFVTQYQQSGLLPVWELGGRETSCMIGFHSVSVINDAYQKGIVALDSIAAFEAVLHTATATHHDMYKYRPARSGLEIVSLFRYAHGWNDYQKHGFIRRSRGMQSVSKTLEYAYDDWCVAQMARKMGKMDDYRKFIKRAEGYKYHLDTVSGFMLGRSRHLVKHFDPAAVTIDYVEGNAWQWSFYVPHDISGQMRLLGGKERLSGMLDSLFRASTTVYGYKHVDVSGLIGQYAHGNEPSHQIAYEYDYTGQPWKTQAMTRRVMNELYRDQPNGLEGNDDCGQMSAWYVFSALGFYPVCPGSDDYAIGSSLVDKATIHLESGKQFVIRANSNSKTNVYIGSAQLNGAAYNKSHIKYNDIMQGGELEFNMTATPNKTWGSDVPVSKIDE
ncbi:MAG: putative alpha,2-mannosidase [Bacteroidetes bacterium]|nr:putative alpha,2-mannosidase [Bacteroidota bacterium]